MAHSQAEILEIWNLTKPVSDRSARAYLVSLEAVMMTPEETWHLNYDRPFLVPKKSGGSRQIMPAGKDLRRVQWILAGWISSSLPLAKDYCYTGKGVLAAVVPHISAKAALVCDLKSAFDYVTRTRVTNELRLFPHVLPRHLVGPLADLLVLGDRARQGCVSTPYLYDFVVKPLEQQLRLIATKVGLTFTLYADNICISATDASFDFEAFAPRIRKLVHAHGWELSLERIDRGKITFLGTQIEDGKIGLDPDKYGQFYDTVLMALQAPNSRDYRRQITGIFAWAHHICGENMPADLLDLFNRYYRKVGRPPRSLVNIVAHAQTFPLFSADSE